MIIGRWIIAGFAILILYGYFAEHRLDDYFKIKRYIKELVRNW